MYGRAHRAPGHLFQLAAGRVNGEALEIQGGSYHTRVIKPAAFTWTGPINLCTRVVYAITLSCSLAFPFPPPLWYMPLWNTVIGWIVNFLKQ